MLKKAKIHVIQPFESPKINTSEIIGANPTEFNKNLKQIFFKIPKIDQEDTIMKEDMSTDDQSPISDRKGEICGKYSIKIGKYNLSERSKKILKYKLKLVKRRQMHPISKKFTGRKNVALNKFRLNGKFAKTSKPTN